MKTAIKLLIAAFAMALSLAASAQGNDTAYCAALVQQYQKFLVKMGGHSPNPGTVDGSVAVEQCKSGNTSAGIPVLERKLRDAKIELPARG